jgi:hypothetical protein
MAARNPGRRGVMAGRSIILASALVCIVTCARSPRTAPENDSIRESDLRADLSFLASGALQGRLTNTPGNLAAAEFIRTRFARLGLEPAGANGDYFQPYDLATAALGASNRMAMTDEHGRRLVFAPGIDFYPHRFSASAEVEGPVTFAGFGITAPGLQHDDLGGKAIRGSIVLVLDHEPGESDPQSPFDGVVRAEASNPLRKAIFAQERGAAGLLIVRDVHNHEGDEDFPRMVAGYWPAEPPRIERYTLAAWMNAVTIPVAQISTAAAEMLVAGTGSSLMDLARDSEAPGGVTPIALPGVRVSMTTDVDRHVVGDRNVLAYLEGGDPQLRNELVIVCAHYDHNGVDGDRVFAGADDDGSGIVGLLEIAEAYARAAAAGERPRRSVLFAAWNSEERGLLGAWAYTEAPFRPLRDTVAVLNMDMIARNEEVPQDQAGSGRFQGLDAQTGASNANAINVIGTTRSDDLKAAVTAANEPYGLELKFRYDNNASNLMRRSDHWPFLQQGVPALWFHTGLHPDYHTERDTPDRIEYAKMTKIARMVHQMSWNVANADGRPALSAR